MMDMFYFFLGLYRISKRRLVIFLSSYFVSITITLGVLAVFHPLYAVVIFVLLFVVTLTGSPVRITPFTLKNVCYGCWNWLRFLVEQPTEQ